MGERFNWNLSMCLIRSMYLLIFFWNRSIIGLFKYSIINHIFFQTRFILINMGLKFATLECNEIIFYN